jgi:hypothetical protein
VLFQYTVDERVISFESLVDGGVDLLSFESILFRHELSVFLSSAGLVFGEHPEHPVGIHEAQGIAPPGIGRVTAPGVSIEPVGDLRAQGVPMDVFDEAEEISVPVTQDGFIPSLEEVTDSAISSVKVHSVGLVQALHDLGERYILCLEQHMHMVVHEYIGIYEAAGAVLVDSEGQKILMEIGGILEYALLLVSANNDVIEGAAIFDARLAGHDKG